MQILGGDLNAKHRRKRGCLRKCVYVYAPRRKYFNYVSGASPRLRRDPL